MLLILVAVGGLQLVLEEGKKALAAGTATKSIEPTGRRNELRMIIQVGYLLEECTLF